MRIIADIPHKSLKITVFKMNDKLSIKFETGLVEQIIKLRDGSPLNDLEKLKEALTKEKVTEIEKMLTRSAQLRTEMEIKATEKIEDEFDEII